MKTSLVVKRRDGKFQRAAMPIDAENDSEVKRRSQPLVVKFSKAHSYKSQPAYFTTDGLKLGKEKNNHQRDAVYVSDCGAIEFENGKADRVRHIDQELVNEIHLIDEQIDALHVKIAELKIKQQGVMEHAFYRGHPLKKQELLSDS